MVENGRFVSLDENETWRQVRVVDAIKVDQERRISLRVLEPGDYYVPAFVSPDIITLRRIEMPGPQPALTADVVKKAILASTLDLGASYDEVRALTREP